MLDRVALGSENWREEATDHPVRIWRNAAGDGLGLFYFEVPPDIPVALAEIDELRRFFRVLVTEAGGGLIELDVVTLDGLAGIRQIVKQPQAGHGMTYIGSYTIPRRSFSYVVKIQCEERGMTGLRETAVLDQALAHGPQALSKDGGMANWAADPYDPDFQAAVLRNQAEDERYDEDFPDHPLSRLRRGLQDVEASLSFAESIKAAADFTPAPRRRTKKPWWRFW